MSFKSFLEELLTEAVSNLGECAKEMNNARSSDSQTLQNTVNDRSKSNYERAAAMQELKKRDAADMERRVQELERREREAERWKQAEAIRRQRQQNK